MSTARLRVRRHLALAARCLVFLLIAFATVELALQLASRFVENRSHGLGSDAEVRILCVGDSHTYGGGVPEEESYPAHLQRLLDERSPGRYSVSNLGIPGVNATQVRDRLPLNLERYRPDVVILWCGVNNAWNRAGADPVHPSWAMRLDRLAYHSRVYRLIRVWWHDRTLRRGFVDSRSRGTQRQADRDELGESPVWTVRHRGVVEYFVNEKREKLTIAEMQESVFRDFSEMATMLRTAETPVIFIKYPWNVFRYSRANAAIEAVSKEWGVPLVDSSVSRRRVPEGVTQMGWATHPSGAVYLEIARDLVPIIEGLTQRPRLSEERWSESAD